MNISKRSFGLILPAVLRDMPGGGGRALNKVLCREAPPWRLQPLTLLYTIFDKKKVPLSYIFYRSTSMF